MVTSKVKFHDPDQMNPHHDCPFSWSMAVDHHASLESIENENLRRSPKKWGGTPSHHPFLDGIFHEIHHPAITGVPHDYGKPPCLLWPNKDLPGVISACERCSQWQHALATFAGLGKTRLRPNLISFNSRRARWQMLFLSFHICFPQKW